MTRGQTGARVSVGGAGRGAHVCAPGAHQPTLSMGPRAPQMPGGQGGKRALVIVSNAPIVPSSTRVRPAMAVPSRLRPEDAPVFLNITPPTPPLYIQGSGLKILQTF